MIWAELSGESVVKVMTALPNKFIHNDVQTSPRRMWGKGNFEAVEDMGFIAGDVVVPEFNRDTHKLVRASVPTLENTTLINGKPTWTKDIVALDEDEVIAVGVAKIVKKQLKIKENTLNLMQEQIPDIYSFDSVCLINRMSKFVDQNALAADTQMVEVLRLYNEAEAKIQALEE